MARHIYLLAICLLLPTGPLLGGEILDPFSGLDEYLRRRSDLEWSKGDIRFYMDHGFIDDPGSDGTGLVLMVSIPDDELRFLRVEEKYAADYRVSLYWKELESGEAQERIWNRRYERSGVYGERSAIHSFQTSLSLKPGNYKVEIEVEDRNARRYGHLSLEMEIPDLRENLPSLSTIFFLENPTGIRGMDCSERRVDSIELSTLGFRRYRTDKIIPFVEVYGSGSDSAEAFLLEMNLFDSTGTVIWEEKKILTGFGDFCSCACEVVAELNGLGRYRLEVMLLDSNGAKMASREKPFFISSSPEWIEDHYETAVEYVRYIASSSELKAMRNAPPEERMKLWRVFWEKRDPFPSTPVNEGLVEYFRRLKYVNRNFTTHIEEGWKTDRGRVYLTLGPPDESIRRERWNNLGTWEIWVYDRSLGFKVVLYFEDRGFTDDYRLINQGTFISAKSRIK